MNNRARSLAPYQAAALAAQQAVDAWDGLDRGDFDESDDVDCAEYRKRCDAMDQADAALIDAEYSMEHAG